MTWNVPNVLTLIRIFLVPVFIIIYIINIPYWNIYADIIFICASLTDMLDGYLARKLNQVSSFGKLWDPIADKLLVLAALLVLMDWGKIGIIITLVLIAREFLISALRQIAAVKGVVIAADKAGKIKTIVQMSAIILILFQNWPFGSYTENIGIVLIWISVVISIYSCINYFVKNSELISDRGKNGNR